MDGPDSEKSLRKQIVTAAAAVGALALPAAASSYYGGDSTQLLQYMPAKKQVHRLPVRPPRRHVHHVTVSPELAAIAQCESHDNPRAIGGGGAFRGKYQFDYGTWASVGGHGDPAAAPEWEQDMRAQMLLERAGTSPWPVCG